MCQDVSERSSWWFWQVESRLLSFLAWQWHKVAPCQGNFVPLPGKKRYVGRKNTSGLSLRFDHSSRPIIRGDLLVNILLSLLLFTLHKTGWNPDKHWGCGRWRVHRHSSPLFTTLHHSSLIVRLRYFFFLGLVIIYVRGWSSFMPGLSHHRWRNLCLPDILFP